MSARTLLRIDGLPVLQNRVYSSANAARAASRGNMDLVQDDDAGFVRNRAFDPALMHYDADYQNEQGCSEVFQGHLDQVMQVLRGHLGARSLIEIGCGKGTFLNHLRAAGFDATGVDPAYEGDSPHVVKAPFTAELGLPPAGAIVLRHVLEHVEQPMGFLRAIADANGGRGTIYIEVPCLDWIRTHRAWFDIFYEHVNYFRPGDFHRMFGQVHEAGHLFGGQYQYVVAELASLRDPASCGPAERVDLSKEFMSGIVRCAALASATEGPKALWGASSKGVIFAHHLAQADVGFDMAIDINPVKQGRFMAGVGIPIVAPAAALERLSQGALVFVMNSNYFDEIAAQARGRFRLAKVDQDEL
ncbi:MAG: methyltransferase domain-containing protein [Hyphomicrobiales bacterium]|nr:MAG: methyltransferase domain-containing protein [Hyphomicrobiales bacterium]